MRTIIILLVLVVSVLGKPEVKQKESLPSGPIVTENSPLQLTDDPGNDINPFLLKGKDGNQYLFWQSDRGGNWGIYWKKCANGQWSEAQTVISNPQDSNHSPQAVMDSQGIIWLLVMHKPNSSIEYSGVIKVLNYDGEQWLESLQLDANSSEDFYYGCIAIDANDVVHVTGHQYTDNTTSIIYCKYYDGQWNNVNFNPATYYPKNPQMLVPSPGNLPWLIYITPFSVPGPDQCHIRVQFLNISGEWNEIHINWPDPESYPDYTDVDLYSAIADSQGFVYTLNHSQLEGPRRFIVRQFNSVTGAEQNNWVLNTTDLGSSRFSNLLLCNDRSAIACTVYDHDRQQMYVRKFDGVNWTIEQPVTGIGDSFNPASQYSTLLADDRITLCTSSFLGDNAELFLYTQELSNDIDTTVVSLEAATNIDDSGNAASIPSDYVLNQNYPNPFNPSTTLSYSLKQPGHVNISIYNMLGQKVVTLVDGYQADLNSFIKWHGRDDSGQPVSSGVYFARMQAGANTKTIKMLFLE